MQERFFRFFLDKIFLGNVYIPIVFIKLDSFYD